MKSKKVKLKVMKNILFFVLISLLNFREIYCQNIYDSIYVGNRWRTYMTHLPTGYNSSFPYPLVFCFHGGQIGAQQSQFGWQAIAYMSILSEKADSAGFIVVYPEGTVINNNRTWNAGLCCPPAMNNNIDDVEFVDHLIDTLKQDYSVDSTRIYASGSSNGAMLCFRLACELSDRIAAFATISAAHEYFPCNPLNKAPIINFHSLVDSAVLYNGGIGNGPSGVNFISQDSTISIWRNINNCISTDTIVDGGTTGYSFIKVHNCSCNVEFDHYVTSDGGHSWPGGNPNNNPVSYQISATYLLWEFFSNYTLGCPTTGVNERQKTIIGDMSVYPNPFNSSAVIRYVLRRSEKVRLVIYNIIGQEIKTIVNGRQSAGQHTVIWDGKDARGNAVGSGVYVYRLEAGQSALSKKMTLLK